MHKILLVDDERNVHYSLQRALGQVCRILSAFTGEDALRQIAAERPHLVLLDVKLPAMGGLEALQRIKAVAPTLPVILLTAYGTTDLAITAMKLGAYDYLLKPVDMTTLKGLLGKALQIQEVGELPGMPAGTEGVAPGVLLGRSPAMQDLYKMIGRVAPTDMTVLISGESGTGKELVAQAIHRHSLRAEGPWVALNCAAIPELLLESELFGHEKGAFTGAADRKPGCFEEASGGTLFLDELGELPLSIQAKLLRALQEKEIRRLGGRKAIAVDVRIIAATNKTLEAAVERQEFREDLYYRLNVLHLHLPPLRARQEDIPVLAQVFLTRYSQEMGRPVRGLTPTALEQLLAYPWPGNVRELENTIQHAILTCGVLITPEDLRLEEQPRPGDAFTTQSNAPSLTQDPLVAGLEHALATHAGNAYHRVEEHLIRTALACTRHNQVQAAQLLGITRHVLRHRMKQYSLL